MNKHIAPIALSIGLLGIVGGVAAANAFSPTEKPSQRQVQLVQPAAETATPAPVETATTGAPATVATVAPKPAPVESTTSAAVKKAPAPVQRQAVVSEPAPETTTSEPAPSAPKVKWGSGGRPTDQVGGVGVTPSPDGAEAPKAK